MCKVVVKVDMGFIIFLLDMLFKLDPGGSDRWVGVSHSDCVCRI